jgi:hypothetical protein
VTRQEFEDREDTVGCVCFALIALAVTGVVGIAKWLSQYGDGWLYTVPLWGPLIGCGFCWVMGKVLGLDVEIKRLDEERQRQE